MGERVREVSAVMWQRARILNVQYLPELAGALIWVRAEPPSSRAGIAVADQTQISVMGYEINLRKEPALLGTGILCIAKEDVELLPDFTDDAPLVPWEQFLAECRGNHE